MFLTFSMFLTIFSGITKWSLTIFTLILFGHFRFIYDSETIFGKSNQIWSNSVNQVKFGRSKNPEHPKHRPRGNVLYERNIERWDTVEKRDSIVDDDCSGCCDGCWPWQPINDDENPCPCPCCWWCWSITIWWWIRSKSLTPTGVDDASVFVTDDAV